MNVFEKAKIIIYLYDDIDLTQSEISKKLGISQSDISKVTQEYGYRYTNKKNKNNLRNGETVNVIHRASALKFLDKYPDENFEEYRFILND